MAESVKVEMPYGHKARLVKIASYDRDYGQMRLEEAKIDILPGRGLELTKRYRFQHVPYHRVFYWRSSREPEDKDQNDEMLAEISLIEENL